MRRFHTAAMSAAILMVAAGSAFAQTSPSPPITPNTAPPPVVVTPEDPELAACRATGLLALKQQAPAVTNLVLDKDSISISKANTKIEETPVKTIIMGEVYLERKDASKDKPKNQTFLCIIGDKGKVLLTFFTSQ
jgi:hypothetical protein